MTVVSEAAAVLRADADNHKLEGKRKCSKGSLEHIFKNTHTKGNEKTRIDKQLSGSQLFFSESKNVEKCIGLSRKWSHVPTCLLDSCD